MACRVLDLRRVVVKGVWVVSSPGRRIQKSQFRATSLVVVLLCLAGQALFLAHTFFIPHWCGPALPRVEEGAAAGSAHRALDRHDAPSLAAPHEDSAQPQLDCPAELSRRPVCWEDAARALRPVPVLYWSTGPPCVVSAPASSRCALDLAPKNSPPVRA